MSNNPFFQELEIAQQALANNDLRQGITRILLVLKKDFTNDPAWKLLYKAFKSNKPFDIFQMELAEKYFPEKVHLLVEKEMDKIMTGSSQEPEPYHSSWTAPIRLEKIPSPVLSSPIPASPVQPQPVTPPTSLSSQPAYSQIPANLPIPKQPAPFSVQSPNASPSKPTNGFMLRFAFRFGLACFIGSLIGVQFGNYTFLYKGFISIIPSIFFFILGGYMGHKFITKV